MNDDFSVQKKYIGFNPYIELIDEDMMSFVSRFNNIYLYGAGKVGVAILSVIEKRVLKNIAGFIVTDTNGNSVCKGKPVFGIDEIDLSEDDGVIVCGNHYNISEIMKELNKKGVSRDNTYVQKMFLNFRNVDEYREKSRNGGYFSDYRELDDVGKLCGTDKINEKNNYLNKYEHFLKKWKDEPITLVELGVFHGSSVKMWGEYFRKGKIIGIDIDKKCEQYKGDNVGIWINDASKKETLEEIRKINPTIIVDDASHKWSHQLKALVSLFGSIKRGGVFIMEDLSTSFMEYSPFGYDDTVISTYDFLSAINEIVVSRRHLRIDKNLPEAFYYRETIEELAEQIELMAFMPWSCVIVKA